MYSWPLKYSTSPSRSANSPSTACTCSRKASFRFRVHNLRPDLSLDREVLALGLAPLVIRDIFRIIQTLHEEGITILLVEQNANAALKIADFAFVLETGFLGMQGTGAELLNDPGIKAAYLGSAKG